MPSVNAGFVLQKIRVILAQTAMEIALQGNDEKEMIRAFAELEDAGAPPPLMASLREQLENRFGEPFDITNLDPVKESIDDTDMQQSTEAARIRLKSKVP